MLLYIPYMDPMGMEEHDCGVDPCCFPAGGLITCQKSQLCGSPWKHLIIPKGENHDPRVPHYHTRVPHIIQVYEVLL